jgi:hypothetical protein
MGKSLGDYLLEQSSLLGTSGVKWTQKTSTNTESKKEKIGKRFQTSSASTFKVIPGFTRKGR